MKLIYTSRFQKNMRLLSKSQKVLVREQLFFFLKNRSDSSLRDHALSGNLSAYRSFSVDADLRVLYRVVNPTCIKLMDIGPHSKVYKP